MLYEENKLNEGINKSIDRFKSELKNISTGKANLDTIQSIMVDAYGSHVSLNTVGQVVILDAVNATVTVWDKSIVPSVEKAIREASIGASVAMDKDLIRLKFNPLTEEDRKEIVRDIRKLLENTKISIRQVRQDFMKKIQSLEGVSEDEQEASEKSIQKNIDESIKKVDAICLEKENQIMKI